MEFNPFGYDFHQDPHPTYAWLREHAPVYHNEGMAFWALSRFTDVLNALHDYGTYSSTGGTTIERTTTTAAEHDDGDAPIRSILDLDQPAHPRSGGSSPGRSRRGRWRSSSRWSSARPTRCWIDSPDEGSSTWSAPSARCSPQR